MSAVVLSDAELDKRCERLAELAGRLDPRKARRIHLRWLQLRWMRVALARSRS